MKKSEKILKDADIPEHLSEYEIMTIENNVLLKHIINNDLPHLWAWVKGIAITLLSSLLGLLAKVALIK